MKRKLLRQEDVRIASPCSAAWEDMLGDEKVRYCHLCAQSVYNFSAMTSLEARLLLKTKNERLCARYFVRKDGTVMTADCPVGLARIRKLAVKRISAAAAFLFGLLAGMPALLLNAWLNLEIRKPLQPSINRAITGVLPAPVKSSDTKGHMGVVIGERFPGPALNPDVPMRLTGGMKYPELIRKVEPIIPPGYHGHGGIAILEAVVARSGKVDRISVLRPLDAALDQAAVNALRRWRYRPALLNGAPVAVWYVITVRFEVR